MPALIAVDAGTTGVRAFAVDGEGRPQGFSYRELTQHFPRPGWVEHDPDEIWAAVQTTLAELAGRLADDGVPVAAVGITNQRGTVVAWDRRTGRPVQRRPDAPLRHPQPGVVGGAVRPVRRAARRPARGAALVGPDRAVRPGPGRRALGAAVGHRRRPAGRPVRPRLLHAGDDQEH